MLPNCKTVRRAKPLLGTVVDISLQSTNHSVAQLNAIASKCFRRVSEIHQMMSYFDPESEISRINQTPAQTKVAVSPETLSILQLACALHTASEGKFDVMYRGRQRHTDASITIHPDGTISRSACAEIDLGGIAKGFAADEAARIASEDLAISGVVNAGGDIVFFGERSHPLAIRSPRFDGSVFKAGNFSNCAIATSVFEADFEPFSVSVRANSCVIADALTKALRSQSHQRRNQLLALYGAQFMQIDSKLGICAGALLQ